MKSHTAFKRGGVGSYYLIAGKKRNEFFIPHSLHMNSNENPAPRKILKSGDGGGQIGDQIRSNLTRFDRLSNRAVECETVRFDRSVPFGGI